MILGTVIFLYPWMARSWNGYRQNMVLDNYRENVQKNLSEKQKEQYLKEANAYNRHLTETTEEDYRKMLSLDENGTMGYLWIPKINLRLPIYHGTQEEVLQKGIGHWKKSGLPVGGKGVNCVLTGHRGLPTAKLFTKLDALEKGDMFYLKVLDKTLAYQVESIFPMVDREDEDTIAKVTAIKKGEDLVTLVTCTPYGVNTHRLMVQGKRVQEVKQKVSDEKQKGKETVQTMMVVLFLLGGAGMVGGYIRVKKKGALLLLCVLMLCGGDLLVSQAVGTTKEEYALALHWAVENQETEVELYRLAVQQEDGKYSYCPGFEELEVLMKQDENNAIKKAVQLAQKQRTLEKLSLKEGYVEVKNLVSGWYLLVPKDTDLYGFSAQLVELSKTQTKNNLAEVYLKYEVRQKEKSPKTGEENILKVKTLRP